MQVQHVYSTGGTYRIYFAAAERNCGTHQLSNPVTIEVPSVGGAGQPFDSDNPLS